MKHLILLFVALCSNVYAQSIKDQIQGDWLCVGIWDAQGQPAKGKFGEPSEYLKFTIQGSTLTMIEAPFDKGFAMEVSIKNNTIDLVPNAVYELPERIYEVIYVTSDEMSLRTKGPTGGLITYKFLNQNKFSANIENKVIDQGVLIVQHLRLSKKNAKSINRVFEYRIPNDPDYLGPSPLYDDPQGSTFGGSFSFNLVLPKDFKLDVPTDEMIIEFDVSDGGASNMKVVNSLGPELDGEVVRVLEKLRKNWKPVNVDGKPVKTTCRFHVYFYMTISEL